MRFSQLEKRAITKSGKRGRYKDGGLPGPEKYSYGGNSLNFVDISVRNSKSNRPDVARRPHFSLRAKLFVIIYLVLLSGVRHGSV